MVLYLNTFSLGNPIYYCSFILAQDFAVAGGAINQELALKDREWTCNECGVIHDRDINASINIKNIGLDNKNKIPMERRKSTLGENRRSNAVRLTQEAPAFRQG